MECKDHVEKQENSVVKIIQDINSGVYDPLLLDKVMYRGANWRRLYLFAISSTS